MPSHVLCASQALLHGTAAASRCRITGGPGPIVHWQLELELQSIEVSLPRRAAISLRPTRTRTVTVTATRTTDPGSNSLGFPKPAGPRPETWLAGYTSTLPVNPFINRHGAASAARWRHWHRRRGLALRRRPPASESGGQDNLNFSERARNRSPQVSFSSFLSGKLEVT